MQLNEFLRPCNVFESRKESMGSIINRFDKHELPDSSLCIAGLSDLQGDTSSADNIRKIFYNLAKPGYFSSIVDLGNIVSGSMQDQQEILGFLTKELQTKNSLFVLLSSNNLLVPDDFCASLMKNKSIVIVDSILDEYGVKNDGQAFIPESISLFHIGIQSYYNYTQNRKSINQVIRLGQFRDQNNDAEPFFRSTPATIINFNSVRYSDFPESFSKNPNGFYAEEICHLSWFSANSNTQKLVILKGFDVSASINNLGVNLISQVIWYLNDGYCKRVLEDPSKSLNGFKEYHIENNKIPEKLVFYQSVRTNKYWFKYGQNSFVACTKQDMIDVLEDIIPDRLWKKMHNS